ncbi:MAG: NYN domain-containing protein [Candidatus Latescibacterota bacterium]
MAEEALIAVFVDFENLAIGLRPDRFQPELVLKRLLEKGRIVYKRAYCDWSQYRSEVRDLHTHGIELIDIPQSRASGKNSADIHMVVDAIDLSYAKQHIDTFALITGDSDFSPLAAKLKENDRRVLGCGVRKSTSDLLISSCDEFLFYDDLVEKAEERQSRGRRRTESRAKARGDARLSQPAGTAGQEEALDKLVQIVASLEEDYDPLWSSLVKQTLRRVDPGFNEKRHGFRTFNDLMQAAEKAGYLTLEHDEARGNDKVRLREG